MTSIAEGPAPDDRRAEARSDRGGMVFCWRGHRPDGSGGVAMRAESIDVSRAGARLAVPRELAPGQSLEVEFLGADGSATVFRTSAAIQWVRPEERGRWQIGCQFAEPMTLPQMVDLLR